MYQSHQYDLFSRSKNSNLDRNSQILANENYFQNKQNQSYQLNRLSKSNYEMINLKQASGLNISKQKQFFLESSKLKHSLIPIYQNSELKNRLERSKLSNHTMVKGCRQQSMRIKVLTQSDLSQNQQDFIEQRSKSQWQQREIQQCSSLNPRIKEIDFNNKQRKPNSNKIIQSYDPSLVDKNRVLKYNQSYQILQDIKHQHETTEEHIYTPPYSFIPNQKLQIKYSQHDIQIKKRQNNKKQINLIDILLLLPHKLQSFHNVKKLIITNCFLTSLQGIQHFCNLEDVNFRKNQLRNVEQLYKIYNKEKITTINILGNDIQHYYLASYQNLSKIFTNLIELNDKNYSSLKRKSKTDMKKVIKKSMKIQYELRKTLKKEMLKNDKVLFRLNPTYISGKSTQRTDLKDMDDVYNNKFQKNDVNCGSEQVVSGREKTISNAKNSMCKNVQCSESLRIRNTENQVYQLDSHNIHSQNYSLGQSSNDHFCCQKFRKQNMNRPNKEVSLGNLQNVPVTKSVRYNQKSDKSDKKQQKQIFKTTANQQYQGNEEIPLQTIPINRNHLQINTQGLDTVSQMNSQIHQPTATFAMQRQKQLKYSQQNKHFMFRNNNNKNSLKNKGKKILYLKESDEVNEDDFFQQNEMNLSHLSKISQIPTKRLSNYNKRNDNSYYQNKTQYRMKQTAENTSEQSFMTGNDLLIPYQQFNQFNHNGSYLGMSNLSQYRPNQSMDEDCLLKDKKKLLEEQQLTFAAALYMRNLQRKGFVGLFMEGGKRKNLPRKRTFF